MDPESERPLRLFVNPFTMWTQLALKTAEATRSKLRSKTNAKRRGGR